MVLCQDLVQVKMRNFSEKVSNSIERNYYLWNTYLHIIIKKFALML